MSTQPARDPVFDLLETTQRETQDLVGALLQVHSDRMRSLVDRDLREQMTHVVDERFSQLELALRPRMARARLEVARGLAQVLNECFQRMRRFESDRHWCDAMLDAASAMSRRSAFFSVRGDDLCLQGVRGLESGSEFPPSEVPYAAAPAFDRVIRSAQTHSVTRNAAELSLPVAAMFGSDNGAHALLVPVMTGDRVPGIIYAEDSVDASAIEAIAAMAGAVLEKHLRLFEPVHSSPSLGRPVAVKAGDSSEDRPAHAIAAPAHPPVHDPADAQAQRFARVEVAKLLLANAAAVSNGRIDRNLFGALRNEIEAMRTAYRTRFAKTPDHLDREIVSRLALNDIALMGGDYTGAAA